MNELVYLAGFPRSGSTVLANVLAMHNRCYSSASSPLHNIIANMRNNWSDDTFLLSQLDHDPDGVHNKLTNSVHAFMKAWAYNDKFEEMCASVPDNNFITIDKNRGWLFDLEFLREINPDFRIIVTLRRLEDIYRSVERQHRKTLMLEFPDHMPYNLVNARANSIFSDQGIVGGVLGGLQNIGDIPDIIEHIYFWRYEDFLDNPQESTNDVFDFLGLEHTDIDFDNIVQSTHESDSYYRMKYLHSINSSVTTPDPQDTPVSPRILKEILSRYSWYYEEYYSEPEEEILDDGSMYVPPVSAPDEGNVSLIQEIHPQNSENTIPQGHVSKTVVNVADIASIAQDLENLIDAEVNS